MVAWFLLMFLLMASARGAFSASTKLCAREVTSIPDPLPSLLIIPALVLAADAVVLVVVLPDVLEVDPLVFVELLLVLLVVLGVVDEVDEDTEVTMGVD